MQSVTANSNRFPTDVAAIGWSLPLPGASTSDREAVSALAKLVEHIIKRHILASRLASKTRQRRWARFVEALERDGARLADNARDDHGVGAFRVLAEVRRHAA